MLPPDHHHEDHWRPQRIFFHFIFFFCTQPLLLPFLLCCKLFLASRLLNFSFICREYWVSFAYGQCNADGCYYGCLVTKFAIIMLLQTGETWRPLTAVCSSKTPQFQQSSAFSFPLCALLLGWQLLWILLICSGFRNQISQTCCDCVRSKLLSLNPEVFCLGVDFIVCPSRHSFPWFRGLLSSPQIWAVGWGGGHRASCC